MVSKFMGGGFPETDGYDPKYENPEFSVTSSDVQLGIDLNNAVRHGVADLGRFSTRQLHYAVKAEIQSESDPQVLQTLRGISLGVSLARQPEIQRMEGDA